MTTTEDATEVLFTQRIILGSEMSDNPFCETFQNASGASSRKARF